MRVVTGGGGGGVRVALGGDVLVLELPKIFASSERLDVLFLMRGGSIRGVSSVSSFTVFRRLDLLCFLREFRVDEVDATRGREAARGLLFFLRLTTRTGSLGVSTSSSS